MIRIMSAREQYEATLPWLRQAADAMGGGADFGADFGQLPDATQGAQTGAQTGGVGAVDLNQDGLIDSQEAQYGAEEAKWSAQESMYDWKTQQARNEAPPKPAPMPAPQQSVPTQPASPTPSAPTPAPAATGGQQAMGGGGGGQTGGGGSVGASMTAGRELRPPRGAPSLWLASQMALPGESDLFPGEPTPDGDVPHGSPTPGGASSSGTII